MYKERASQVGKIMTNPRKKSDTLSKTAKKTVEEAYLRNKYNIRNEFWSKQMTKGIEVENDSIDLVSRKLGLFNVKKNEDYFENDFFTGTPDIITNDYIIDVKSSWSGSTFPWFEDNIPTKDYIYQLLVYMNLTGVKKALLAYCLVDAPEDMILDETRRQAWKEKLIDVPQSFEDKVREQMTFQEIPEMNRVKIYEVEYNEQTIKEIEERVLLCRDYYNSLSEKIEINSESINN